MAGVAFVTAAWGLPAVYQVRYAPRTSGTVRLIATSRDGAPGGLTDAAYQSLTHGQALAGGAGIQGLDGWQFLGDPFNANIAQATGRRHLSAEELATVLKSARSERAYLAARGIASLYVIVPAKWDIYSDKMPAWAVTRAGPHSLDELYQADPSDFVDLRQTLKQGRSSADTYSRFNSHWTDYGAMVAYNRLVDVLQASHRQFSGLLTATARRVSVTDAHNEMRLITGAMGPNNWTVPHLDQPLPPYSATLASGETVRKPGGGTLDMMTMPLVTQNPHAGNQHRVLVLTDSAITAISPYFGAAFKSTMMVRHYADQPLLAPNVPHLVETYHPDLVVTLLSERNLNQVPTRADADAWAAAAAYTSAPRAPYGSWSSAAPGGSISVTVKGAGRGSTITATLPRIAGDTVLRIELDSAKPALARLTTGEGDHPMTRSVKLAAGRGVYYVALPPGAALGPLTLTSDGSAVLAPVSVTAVNL